MISHKHKCIFVHIPKTGGTSIEKVIWPLKSDRVIENLWMGFIKEHYNKYQTGGLQHLTSSQIRNEVGVEVFNSYYKFSVVRNPWEKAISQYIYMKEKRKDLRQFVGMSKFTSFKSYLSLISKKTHVQWMKQVDFIKRRNGDFLVDNVIKFENLEKETQMVFGILGIKNIKLPHANKSNKMHYSSYYDDESIEMIYSLYKEDIETFNYKFDY